MIVVHTAAVVGKWIDAVRERVVVNRDQDVRVGVVGQPDPWPEAHGAVRRPRHDDDGPVVRQELSQLERDGQVRLRLGEASGPRGTCRWMAGIDQDDPVPQGMGRIDGRRAADLEDEIAPAPAGPVSPHRVCQFERDGHLIGRRLVPAHALDERIGPAVLDPVDVAVGTVEPDDDFRFRFPDLKRHSIAERDPCGDLGTFRSEDNRSHAGAKRGPPRGKRLGVGGRDPGLGTS